MKQALLSYFNETVKTIMYAELLYKLIPRVIKNLRNPELSQEIYTQKKASKAL